jgi:dihydroxyacid dehydratase/phosphogluconate dehydratase
MTTLRSLAANSAIRRSHWRTLGLSEADMLKPKIAVVNSSSELAVCFAHLDGVARVVKDAIRAAGGIPFEVRTTAPSDFITGAACSGSYILAARDLVTNDIEAQVEAALLDGMVCLTSCDKTPPGHLMAAGRLNIPTVLVIGGYQASGMIRGEHVDIEDLFSGSVGAALGKPGKFSMVELSEQAIRGPGVCAGMATANTMHCVVEALGMCVPGSAPVRANSEKMFDAARRAGTRIVAMVNEGLTPRNVLTEAAFRNAVAMVLGVSGSINAIKHLQATAVEAGVDVDIYALWDEMGRKVPILSAVRPNGAVRIEQFEDAGGAGAVLKRLAPVLDTSALTVTGQTLAEVLAGAGERSGQARDPRRQPSGVLRRPCGRLREHAECDGGHCRGQARKGKGAGAARPGPQGRTGHGWRRLAGIVCDPCRGSGARHSVRDRWPALRTVLEGPDSRRGGAGRGDRRTDWQGSHRRSHRHRCRGAPARSRRAGRGARGATGAAASLSGRCQGVSGHLPARRAADGDRRGAD